MCIVFRKRCWCLFAVLCGAVAVLKAYFTAIMYLNNSNSLNGIDSELCMWLSMGQDACLSFPHCGLLRLNYSRGIVQWAVNVILAEIVGVSVWKAMAVVAAFNAIVVVGMASLLSIKRDEVDGKIRLSLVQFVVLIMFQSAFYFVNVGHEMSYVLASAGLFVVQWRFARDWKRHVLAALITSLGVLV